MTPTLFRGAAVAVAAAGMAAIALLTAPAAMAEEGGTGDRTPAVVADPSPNSTAYSATPSPVADPSPNSSPHSTTAAPTPTGSTPTPGPSVSGVVTTRPASTSPSVLGTTATRPSELPRTGSPALALLVVGAAMVAAGLVARFALRRDGAHLG